MKRARLVLILLFGLALGGGLLACDNGAPPAPSGPVATGTAPAAASPSPTLAPPTSTPALSATPAPTNTPAPPQGPVRTPVGGAAGPEFMAALAAMDSADSYRYTLQLQIGAPEARYVLTGTGTYQAPGNYDTNFNALGFNTEILVLGDTTYVRSYGVWHQGPPDATLYPMGPPPNIADVIGLPSYAIDAALVGDGNDTLNGQPLRHYRFLLRASSLIGPDPDLGISGGELWADPATHRFRRLLLTFGRPDAPGDNDGTLQLDFSNYGVSVTLTPPPLPPTAVPSTPTPGLTPTLTPTPAPAP